MAFGRWRFRWTSDRGFSPVKRFAALSVIPFVGLGLILSSTVHQVIQDRYLYMYGESAEVTVTSVATIVLSDPNMEAQVLKSGPGKLSSLVRGLEAVEVYAPDGTVSFTEEPATPRSSPPASVHEALLTGRTVARFTDSLPPSVRLPLPAVELAIPVYQGKAVIDVVHAYGSAADLESGIAAGMRRANLLLAAGLGLVWLLLFPVVLSASRRLRRQALHDSLTGLANRYLFADRFAQATSAADRRGEKVGLLLLDLDRFKEVNDSLGHQHGDEFLSKVATALTAQVRSTDTLARLGGDEFAVVLTGVDNHEQCLVAARRLLEALENPIDIEGVAVTPQASIGLSVYPDHGSAPDTLLAKADIAMYAAKAVHQGIAVYTPEKDFSVPARLGLVTDLRRALASDEITCYYQPIVGTVEGRVLGVEALVRWAHPSRGIVSPAEFLPVVEQAGLTGALTSRVLGVALRQCREWRDRGLDLVVAVNLSPRSLRDTALPDLVFTALAEAGVPPGSLELEITEEALLEDPTQAKITLEVLAERGIRIALDDFGTGYSSLAYLSHLPVGKVKIDRAFLTDLDSDEMNEKIVETVVGLGRRLGMEVLAEGVETVEVWNRLLHIGCPQAQGFYLARPMPAEEIPSWRSKYLTVAPVTA